MSRCSSPIRYPGGKSRHTKKILRYFRPNETKYREPFVGGASVYLASGFKNAWINDIDPDVFAFWQAVKTKPCELIELLKEHTPILDHGGDPERIRIALDFWRSIQNDRYCQLFPAGYRFLFLNKTCFSGVQTGGPTGGLKQDKYQLTSRWSLDTTIRLICQAHQVLQDCRITNLGWDEVVKESDPEAAYYLDPPYLEKGDQCYRYSFTEPQHRELAHWLTQTPCRFVLTVDDCPVIRRIYMEEGVSEEQMLCEQWLYSMSDYRESNRVGKELFVVDVRSIEALRRNMPRRRVQKEIFGV